MAPIVAYLFTLAAGTGHIVYALLPVIAEVSRSAGVRPERPLSISVIASQQAMTASPISAATAALLGLLGPSLSSQAATVVTLMPAGVALGLGAPAMIAMFPSVNGYFFLPTYATLLTAISFDQTGTTKIGKYLLNRSFMLPGMVATVLSVVIGFGLAKLIF